MQLTRLGHGRVVGAIIAAVVGVVISLVIGAVMSAVVILTGPAIGRAATEDTAAVCTDPTGARVELGRRQTWFEVGSGGGGGGAPTTGCRRRWIPSGAFQLRKTITGDYRTVPMDEPRPGPEYTPYQVWCGPDYIATVWLRPQQFGVDPRVLAEGLVRDLPYPAAAVGVSPGGRGLTGLESWFWVEGYRATAIVDTVTQFGMTVDVEAVPTSVSWDFGDGTSMAGVADASGLGEAPPARSGITHTFERRARPTYTVRSLIRLAVRWRLNGGPWENLAPVFRTATRDYPVVESRAALVPSG